MSAIRLIRIDDDLRRVVDERRGSFTTAYRASPGGELLKRALQSGDVREVIAHTLPERNASTRILEKIGLRMVGEADDAEVGKAGRWAYRPGPPEPGDD